MKLAVAALLVATQVDARSAWGTLKGTKQQQRNEDDRGDLNFSWFTHYVKEQMMLSGTFEVTFKEDKQPKAGKSVRICMAYKNDERERNNEDWEHVSFFLPAFEESDWYVRYRSSTNFEDRFCNDQLDDNNLVDGIWKVKDQYWDKDARRLLIDV